MRFHLCHIFPDPRTHGLLGYAEVIESIRWGLTELGHAVSVAQNHWDQNPGTINILFGAQLLAAEDVETRLPEGSVIYNFEQIANVEPSRLKPTYLAAAKRCRIWDYDPGNIETWKTTQPRYQPMLVPVGWAPTLQKIPKLRVQDEVIDVLMYGTPDTNRLNAIHELGDLNSRVVFASGVYGALRDDLISRSKLVLNINRYPQARAFEIVRVSYLLGNGKAVVSDFHAEYQIDEDLKQAIAFCPLEQIVATCQRLLAEPSERRRLESAGPRAMQRRDIRMILRAPVAALEG
jgi:hypothetical protein